MWKVLRIEEADYGCEERLPGEPLMVLVTIENEIGQMARFECADNWLLLQGIDEGDEWPEDIEEIDAEEERAGQRAGLMSEWLDNYYKAMEEMDEHEEE
ncbi:MAG: hypothetical protein K6E13_02065 [Lachnospiraceae bacterium]|nr:hypothetical protein [Lachnospiraceae bacterium]